MSTLAALSTTQPSREKKIFPIRSYDLLNDFGDHKLIRAVVTGKGLSGKMEFVEEIKISNDELKVRLALSSPITR